MTPRWGIDKLSRDPHTVLSLLNTAFQYIPHPQLSTHLLNFHRLPLIGERRITCNYKEFWHFGERSNNILGDPVAEILLLRISAHIDKGQHGYGGFIQDDSGGFVTVGALLREILQADTRIVKAEADPDSNLIRIATADGGTATTSPRRGITPAEARLIRGLEGQDALFCQSVAISTMGRMYGQGVLETPVALEAALANAVVDGFTKKAQAEFKLARESIEGNSGLLGGLSVEKNGAAVSYLLSVNYTTGGIGPVEDLEGNIALGSKGQVMRKLEMVRCPTIVVEGKVYLPSISDQLEQNTFLVRAQEGVDNVVVAQALAESADELDYPVLLRDDLLPRVEGSVAQQTVDLAGRIIDCAQRLKRYKLASQKAEIVAELAELVSQDAGAITCLSDEVHEVVRGVGIIPGTSAALSLLVTRSYYEHWKIPMFEPADAQRAGEIIDLATEKIVASYDAAWENLQRNYVSLEPLEHLVSGAKKGTTHPPTPD